jgi:hypothetical protein
MSAPWLTSIWHRSPRVPHCPNCDEPITRGWRCNNLLFCDIDCAAEFACSGLRRVERLARSVS